MKTNEVLDIIITLLKSEKNGGKIKTTYHGKECTINNTRYLLIQILRQYNVPADHYFVSKSASKLWEKLSKKDINQFYYRETITCESSNPINVKKYKGNENIGIDCTLYNGDKFMYREIFHNEHIIPITMIVNELLNLSTINYDTIFNILNHIYICRMTKEEDRKIKEKQRRFYNCDEVIKKIYNKYGIFIAS